MAAFFLGCVLAVNSILMPLYLQGVRHKDALGAGLLVSPRGIGATAGTWLSGRLMERYGTGVAALVGSALTLLLTAPWLFLGANTSYTFIIVFGLLQGLAIGMSVMPAQTAGYRALRTDQINDATPQLNILLRVGSSIGTAILIGILQHSLVSAGRSVSAQAHAYGSTFGWLMVLSIPAVLAAAVLVAVERNRSFTIADVDEIGAPETAVPATEM